LIIVLKKDKQELETIQLEAVRIVTGTTQLVSHERLYKETGWLPLDLRRKIHKLTLFYKSMHRLTPKLSSLTNCTN